ncbi:MAG: NUDIX domain-containing protein [Gammaproteobacteria bacterium]|nr:MAG: NUDIX domain-containing protein [Gammaproteobacteria bacterium]
MRLIRAVVGVLKREGKLLVAERPQGKSYSGYWEFPGGKIEADETGEAALVRELQEELGIDVILAKHWLDYTYSYPDKTVALEIWRVDDFTGEPHGKENQQLLWVTYAELLSLHLLDGVRPMMGHLQSLMESV